MPATVAPIHSRTHGNVTQSRRQVRLAEPPIAPDIAAATAAAEVAILMVPDTPDVEAVLFGARGVAEGLKPGTLVIEACTNLAGWVPVFTNTTPTNVLFYTDPEAANKPARFYRAFQLP